MWEFALRVIGGGALVAVAGFLGKPDFDVAWKIAVLTGAYAFLAYAIEHRGKTNPGFAGLVSGLDSLAISAAAAYSGLLPELGWLVVAPISYAVTKRGSNPLATGAIGSAALLSAHELVNPGQMPTPLLFGQAAGVFAIGMLVNQPRVVVRPRSIQEMIAELAEENGADEDTSTQALIELREQHRRLGRSFKELERRTRVDRIASQMLLARRAPGAEFGPIVERLRTLIQADGLVLYTANQATESMVVSASAGRVPDDSGALSFPANSRDAAHKLKDKAAEALRAIGGDGAGSSANVLLKHRGQLVGMLTVIADMQESLDAARQLAEEVSDSLAHIILDERAKRRSNRRLAEAELLYEIACRLDGATTEPDLGRRTARALHEVISCDHVGVWILDNAKPILLGRGGRSVQVHEFIEGGVTRWIGENAPDIRAYSTSENPWLDAKECARARIGSLIVASISDGKEAIGFITAAAGPHGALTPDDARAMTEVAAELAHTMLALRSHRQGGDTPQAHGLLSVREFQRAVVEMGAKQATMVHIEPLHFDELEPTVGRPAVELAARKLGLLCRRHAPREAQACRKADGSYVVLLPDMDIDATEGWANSVVALAATQTVDSPETHLPISLAVRARVADLDERIEKTGRKSPAA